MPPQKKRKKPEMKITGKVLKVPSIYSNIDRDNISGRTRKKIIDAITAGDQKGLNNALFQGLAETRPQKAIRIRMSYYEKTGALRSSPKLESEVKRIIQDKLKGITFKGHKAKYAAYRAADEYLKSQMEAQTAKKIERRKRRTRAEFRRYLLAYMVNKNLANLSKRVENRKKELEERYFPKGFKKHGQPGYKQEWKRWNDIQNRDPELNKRIATHRKADRARMAVLNEIGVNQSLLFSGFPNTSVGAVATLIAPLLMNVAIDDPVIRDILKREKKIRGIEGLKRIVRRDMDEFLGKRRNIKVLRDLFTDEDWKAWQILYKRLKV